MSQLLPPKKEVALALLERSNVDVYLDPRSKGVVVPPQFRKEPRLILKIGLNMPVPIPDLRLDDESMSCTLSFSRSPFFCIVPWESVFAMVGDDGRGMVWPDDVPQELAVRVVEDRKAPSDRESAAAPTSPRRRSAKEKAAAAADAATEIPADRPSRGKRTKKKKEEEKRPMLMAVPTAPAPGLRSEKLEKPEKLEKLEKLEKVAAVPPAKRSPQAPPPSARSGGAGAGASGPPSRPKRELPPYLRVVK